MKLAYFVGLGLVLAPLGVKAQSGAPVRQSNGVAGVVQMENGGQTRTLPVALPPGACPVSLQARHLADGTMVKTGASHPREQGQRLQLTLTSPDTRTLASATFNVLGWTAQGHLEQTRAHGAQSADGAQAVRTVQTPLAAGAGRNASADLWAPGLTAVESVELVAVAYTDGSTWTPAAGKSCRVTPDPLMLIAQ